MKRYVGLAIVLVVALMMSFSANATAESLTCSTGELGDARTCEFQLDETVFNSILDVRAQFDDTIAGTIDVQWLDADGDVAGAWTCYATPAPIVDIDGDHGVGGLCLQTVAEATYAPGTQTIRVESFAGAATVAISFSSEDDGLY